jgi:hypothetical protein
MIDDVGGREPPRKDDTMTYTISAGQYDSTLSACGALRPYDSADEAIEALEAVAGPLLGRATTGDGGTILLYRTEEDEESDASGAAPRLAVASVRIGGAS